jgi:hypothetical protein
METPKRKRSLFENDKSTPSPKRDHKEFSMDNKLDLITDSEKNSQNYTEGFKFKI